MTKAIVIKETGEIEQPQIEVIRDVRTAIERVRPGVKTVLDAKNLSKQARAAQAFYAAQGSEDNAQAAKAVALWADREAGQFLKDMDKNEGGRPITSNIVLQVNDTPTLADLDIDRMEASRWQLMAEIPEEDFIYYIDTKIAKGYELTAGGLVKIGKQIKHKDEIDRLRTDIKSGKTKLPEGVFEIISLDPPWPYGTEYDPEGRRAANPYPEMSLEQIQALELPAAENCILWLWTTHKFMRHSFELLDGWGFRDVMILTWVKDRMGLGTWLRSQSEFCIMAVKGKPVIELTNQTTVINGKLREHSRKPDEFYQMVDSLCVGRKLDYFSREKRTGWEQMGNDTKKF